LNLENLILNQVSIKKNEKFVAIIGASPSKGARSPKLWNRVYKNIGKKIKMYPFDVEEKKLKKLIFYLSLNKNFLGGAITNPFKEKVFKLLKSNIDTSSRPIGAINCLYRKKQKIYGINTDRNGALYSLKKLGKLENKKYMIIGTGGTALTLVSLLKKYVSKPNDILVIGRNRYKLNVFKKKFRCSCKNLTKLNSLKLDIDFIINCTDLGSITKRNYSILPQSFFNRLNKNTKIFDVIYNPKQTLFLKYAKRSNLKFENGLNMNLHQAVNAFVYTNHIKIKSYKKIEKIMSKK
tara:strand:+ start:676 stop:1554 length:879 start_codon:yes stop_codon:yes gene_type:complete